MKVVVDGNNGRAELLGLDVAQKCINAADKREVKKYIESAGSKADCWLQHPRALQRCGLCEEHDTQRSAAHTAAFGATVLLAWGTGG